MKRVMLLAFGSILLLAAPSCGGDGGGKQESQDVADQVSPHDGVTEDLPDAALPDLADGTVPPDEAVPSDVASGRLDKCYTPCKAGLVRDGKYIPCSEDGLMEGCLGKTVCVSGWCVTPLPNPAAKGDDPDPQQPTPTACESDCDCPEHGKCIEGYCGHQCEPGSGNGQCAEGETCYKSVCRGDCSSDPDSPLTCPEGEWCQVGSDGVNGRCMPTCSGQEADVGEPQCALSAFEVGMETFTLEGTEAGVIRFTPDKTKQTLSLSNNTGCPLSFSLKRQSHVEYTDSGTKNVVTNPLAWITLKTGTTEASGIETLDFVVPAGETAAVEVGGAKNEALQNWSGDLMLQSLDKLGDTQIRLTYASGASGAWEGKAYYFANFGTDNLELWLQNGRSPAYLDNVNNAFLRRWDLFRRGQISTDNFLAMLSSTQTGSWAWSNVIAACPTTVGACYPFANPAEGNNDDGVEKYSDDLARYEIPSGMVELPVTLYLQQQTDDNTVLRGRIKSLDALHYAGDPEVTLQMTQNASECTAVGEFDTCVNGVEQMDASIVVGGRFFPNDSWQCSDVDGFISAQVPWLLQDFLKGTQFDTSHRYKTECRDQMQPYADTPAESELTATQLNLSLANSNPLPDGQSITRSLQIVDGAMINKDRMFIIFKEQFSVKMVPIISPSSGLPEELTEDFSGYGVLVLTRQPEVPEANEYMGNPQEETRTQPEGVLGMQCSDDMLGMAGFMAMPTTDEDRMELANVMLSGVPSNVTLSPVTKTVHYLCWETGQFELNSARPGPCPVGSPVTFFYFTGTDPLATEHACSADAKFQTVDTTTGTTVSAVEQPGSCDSVLQAWKNAYGAEIIVDPYYTCTTNPCSEDANNRKGGKVFKSASTLGGPVMSDVKAATTDAFRYKVMFRSRQGKSIGFAPEQCVEGSTLVPYCYSPTIIEQLRDRTDCAMYLYFNYFHDSTSQTADDLRSFLQDALSSGCLDDGLGAEACTWPQNRLDGLETLGAELMIMLGDESYTAAFSARFDLAASTKAAFEGSLFEPQGIDLGGVAGFEMYSLYKATEYYQLVLDRFYSMLPALSLDLNLAMDPSGTYLGLFTLETVTDYLDRLIRASTQKSRAWSEIAKRYQGFNRPDLAQRVLQRAYTATYLESILVTRLMHRAIDALSPENRPQIKSIIESAQISYKAALLEMRDVSQTITSSPTIFGFPVDYVPFPAIGQGEVNSFEKALATAWEAVDFAADKEGSALADKRAYDTDSASFQAELVQIRSTYESALVDLCGSMDGDDGVVHAAILEYAYLNEKARSIGDPCGLMGNGAIYEAILGIQAKQMALNKMIDDRAATMTRIQIQVDKIKDICDEIEELKDFKLTMNDVKIGLQSAIDASDIIVNAIKRAEDTVTNIANLSKCTVGVATDCPTAAWSIGVVAGTKGWAAVGLAAQEILKAGLNKGMMIADKETVRFELDTQCDLAQIDSEATIRNLILDYLGQNTEVAQAAIDVQMAYAELEELTNKAAITRTEYNEIWEQAINVEAARNDPNVRIYKNDSVINAEKAFDLAIKEAYRATKVFEYYTSQSYAHLVDLFLIRMVSFGDYNLENYMMELQTEYNNFVEQYGAPDTRLQVVSLRDDVFQIPVYRDDAPGESLSASERAKLFVERLTDGYGARGYTVDFSTRLDDLSPLTRNHKIKYVEVELVGENTGDFVARSYLVQSGTGTLWCVDDSKEYYRLPARTAVVDMFMNGDRPFDDAGLYQTYNLKDRPLANTKWQFILDVVGEMVNRDIAVDTIEDVRIYVYYEDFTAL